MTLTKDQGGIASSTAAMPTDDLSPDSIKTSFLLQIENLERFAEGRQIALDWGTIRFQIIPGLRHDQSFLKLEANEL